MDKYLYLSLFLCVFSSVYSDEYRYYNFNPILVEKGVNIRFISNLDDKNIIVGGTKVVHDAPFTEAYNTALYKSNNGGLTWVNCYLDTNEKLDPSDRFEFELDDIYYLSKDRIIAFYQGGYVLISDDGGKSWERDTINISYSFLVAKFLDDKNGIVLCNKSITPFSSKWEFIKTSDGGISWKIFHIPMDSIFDVSTALYTPNFSYKPGIFQFVQETYEPQNDSINTITHYIVKSTDDGKTWEKILLFKQDSVNYRLPKTYMYIRSQVQFINKNKAIWFGATPSQTLVYGVNSPWQYPFLRESNDGGSSWNELFYDQDSSVMSMSPFQLLYQDIDKYIFKTKGDISVYEFGRQKYVRIMPNDFKNLTENYGYAFPLDYTYLGGDDFIVTGNSNYIFKFNYRNPTVVIDESPITSNILIYPNPVKNVLNIGSDNSVRGYYNLKLFSADSKLIINKKVYIDNGSKFDLDVPTGTYYLLLEGDNYFYSKIVKE